jgi:hypothetical protein
MVKYLALLYIVTSLVLQFVANSRGHFPKNFCDWEDWDLMGIEFLGTTVTVNIKNPFFHKTVVLYFNTIVLDKKFECL